mgnify:CR=1 FL=1
MAEGLTARGGEVTGRTGVLICKLKELAQGGGGTGAAGYVTVVGGKITAVTINNPGKDASLWFESASNRECHSQW